MQVYTRLQKLNLSLSRQCTLTYLDEIGKEYDRPVLEWKSSIESEMKSLQVIIIYTSSLCYRSECI